MKRKPLKRKYKSLQPYIVINKKKHPFGKPITISFNDLRMWAAVSYKCSMGFTKKGQIGFANNIPNDITIFFETKREHGWLYLEKKEAESLRDVLNMLLKVNKKGFATKTYTGTKITKHQRYD